MGGAMNQVLELLAEISKDAKKAKEKMIEIDILIAGIEDKYRRIAIELLKLK